MYKLKENIKIIPFLGNKYYYINTFGDVYSMHNNKIVKLKPCFTKSNYIHITLSICNTRKCYVVHRLVALTFIPNPCNKPQVNHIDGNKKNNNVLNLEWVDNSENQKHAYRLGLQKIQYERLRKIRKKARLSVIKKRSKSIVGIHATTGMSVYFNSMADAQRTGLFNQGMISECCNEKRKTHKGYIWNYAYEGETLL